MKQPSLNHIMKRVGKIMLDLYPLIVARRELQGPEIQRIDGDLSEMSQLFLQARPYVQDLPDGYQVSYEFISMYLGNLRYHFNKDDMEFTRRQLYALGEICSSCHTQDNTLRTLFYGVSRHHFVSDMDYAEFSYMTREYATATKYYDKYLKSKSRKTEWELIQPLQRMVTIYIQVNSEAQALLDLLKPYRTLKQHTPETLSELEGWIRGLQRLVQRNGADGAKTVLGFPAMMAEVGRLLGPLENSDEPAAGSAQLDVMRLWLRGRMYQYLNSNPGAHEVPVLLYWLAVADRSVAYQYYFSLSDLYLKHCVLQYPEHPYAKRCLAEYENYMRITYTNQGQRIPEGLENELMLMRKTLTVE
ncbi:MAG: hypothetical protein OEZ68_11685 [Gammaproteobacteria bacterium]|nr:hypothetical protein [Gammaproteobacteria bacterium]MDH5801455.1 hypothetical protein [Gammaproteobacteria bacterium]